MKRSPILDASRRYWRWLGATLDALSERVTHRRRSFLLFGGCLFWLVFGLFYLIALLMLGTLFVAALGALAFVGVLLSAAGGVGQLRIAVLTRRNAPAD